VDDSQQYNRGAELQQLIYFDAAAGKAGRADHGLRIARVNSPRSLT
jgi:hypothetical protein